VSKSEIGINLLQQGGKRRAFVLQLVLGAEDVAIVLCKTAHAHQTM